MPAFDFPNSPTNGQVVANGPIQFAWDTKKWVAGPAAGAGPYVAKSGDQMTGALGVGTAVPIGTSPDTVLANILSAPTHAWNAYNDGAWKGQGYNAIEAAIGVDTSKLIFYTAPNVAAGATVALYNQMTLDTGGNLVLNSAGAVSLSAGVRGTGANDTINIWATAGGDGGIIALRGPTYSALPNATQIYAGPASARQTWNFQQNGLLATPGAITAPGTITSTTNRIISQGNNNPSLTAYNTAGYAVASWCDNAGNYCMGFADVAGVPSGNYLYIARSDLNVYAPRSLTVNNSLYADWLRVANGIMSVNGYFFVADNSNYFLGRRPSDGVWSFTENGQWNLQVSPNGDTQVRGNLYGYTHIYSYNNVYAGNDWGFYFGKSGSAKYFQFQSNWYWYWDGNNGNLLWMNASSANWEWVIHSNSSCYNGVNWVGGYGAYQNLSDERAKEDIEPAAVGLDEILKIRPIRFTRVPNTRNGSRPSAMLDREIGFGAKTLREIIPEAVTTMGIELADGSGALDSDAPSLGIDITPIVAGLVNAVQQMHARLSALEGAR